MLLTEYESLQRVAKLITGSMLQNQRDRTLLYGYTFDRESFHTYLEDGVIKRVIYNHQDIILSFMTEDSAETNNYYIPSKRAYPERCDYEFCKLLLEHGASIPFTNFDETMFTRFPQLMAASYFGIIKKETEDA